MKKVYEKLKKTRNFAETPEEFSEEVIDGLFKDLEHKKSRAPICRTAALRRRNNRKRNNAKKMMNFQISIKKFNEVNDAATQHKKDNEVIDLVDNIMDYDNPFKDTFTADPEDIFIDDNLFDDFDQNDKK